MNPLQKSALNEFVLEILAAMFPDKETREETFLFFHKKRISDLSKRGRTYRVVYYRATGDIIFYDASLRPCEPIDEYMALYEDAVNEVCLK